MSQEMKSTELQEQTQQLLDGPLKHIRAAALAAVLDRKSTRLNSSH